jgi:predicted AlkP superfamily pyrophosphatase or phosphodiesterase
VSGPESAEVRAAAENVDRALGQLRAKLETMPVAKSLNVIVVSDHGMSQLSRDRVIYLEDYIDVSALTLVDSSPNMGVMSNTLTPDQIHERLSGRHPSLKVYRKADIPARLQYGTHPRIAPIFIMADDGWAIFARRGGTPLNRFGAHGYDNQTESMQGLFVAAGPAFRRGIRIDRFRSVDVYELMCRILGVTPNKNDGDPKAYSGLLSISKVSLSSAMPIVTVPPFSSLPNRISSVSGSRTSR